MVEIVSMDSMAVYRGMDIGTTTPRTGGAGPGAAPPDRPGRSRRGVHRRRVRPCRDAHSTTSSREAAWAILVGGTGLYVQARGRCAGPPGRFPRSRRRLEAEPDTRVLYERLVRARPRRGGAGSIPTTVDGSCGRSRSRSVPVGRSPRSVPAWMPIPPTPFVLVGLDLDRQVLAARIAAAGRRAAGAGLPRRGPCAARASRRLSRTAAQALGLRRAVGAPAWRVHAGRGGRHDHAAHPPVRRAPDPLVPTGPPDRVARPRRRHVAGRSTRSIDQLASERADPVRRTRSGAGYEHHYGGPSRASSHPGRRRWRSRVAPHQAPRPRQRLPASRWPLTIPSSCPTRRWRARCATVAPGSAPTGCCTRSPRPSPTTTRAWCCSTPTVPRPRSPATASGAWARRCCAPTVRTRARCGSRPPAGCGRCARSAVMPTTSCGSRSTWAPPDPGPRSAHVRWRSPRSGGRPSTSATPIWCCWCSDPGPGRPGRRRSGARGRTTPTASTCTCSRGRGVATDSVCGCGSVVQGSPRRAGPARSPRRRRPRTGGWSTTG